LGEALRILRGRRQGTGAIGFACASVGQKRGGAVESCTKYKDNWTKYNNSEFGWSEVSRAVLVCGNTIKLVEIYVYLPVVDTGLISRV
jgi:hypothetical protein